MIKLAAIWTDVNTYQNPHSHIMIQHTLDVNSKYTVLLWRLTDNTAA